MGNNMIPCVYGGEMLCTFISVGNYPIAGTKYNSLVFTIKPKNVPLFLSLLCVVYWPAKIEQKVQYER